MYLVPGKESCDISLKDCSLVSSPCYAHRLSFSEFMDLAMARPDLALRNTAQFFADAIKAYGVETEEVFGKTIPVYGCTDGPFLSDNLLERHVPYGQQEVIHALVQKLEEEGKKARPTKGILLSGVPGAGKNCVVDSLLATLVDYANNHPDGARWRVGLRLDARSKAIENIGLAPITSPDEGDNLNGGSRKEITIVSSTNANPIALLDVNRPFYRSPNGSLLRGSSERDSFIERCESGLSDGVALNREFVLGAGLDPTISYAYNALVDYYTENETKGDKTAAIELVRDRHVFVERWQFLPERGDGVLTKMPHVDQHSDAQSLAGPARAQRILKGKTAIDGQAEEIWKFSGPLLRTDVIHFEDMLMLVRAPQELLHYGHLNALIERGMLQVVSHEDPSRVFTITKDISVLGTVNDAHIQALREGTSFNAMFDRFHVITCPLIRDYKAEAMAHDPALQLLMGQDMTATPNALDVASVFFVATRLLNPQAATMITPDTRVRVHSIARRLRGVAKAVYLGSNDASEARTMLNHVVDGDDKFSTSDMQALTHPQVKAALSHEYPGDIMKQSTALYDGGFGISTRAAQSMIERMVARARAQDEDFTVRHVVDVLKEQAQAGFHYFEAPSATLDQIKKQMFGQLCQKNGLTQGDIEKLVDTSGRLQGKAKQLWEEATKNAESSFPFRSPQELVNQTEQLAKRLVQADARAANGLYSEGLLQERMLAYVVNLAAYATKGEQKVPAKFGLHDPSLVDRTREEKLYGHDESTMRIIEEELKIRLADRSEFRQALWGKVASWVVKSNTEQRNANGQPTGQSEPVSLVKNYEDLFKEQAFAEMLAELRNNEETRQQGIIKKFIENVSRYHLDPKLIERELEDTDKRGAAEQYLSAMEKLVDKGYTMRTLPGLLAWAF
jgi:predicted Ser/Thr protein kinase